MHLCVRRLAEDGFSVGAAHPAAGPARAAPVPAVRHRRAPRRSRRRVHQRPVDEPRQRLRFGGADLAFVHQALQQGGQRRDAGGCWAGSEAGPSTARASCSAMRWISGSVAMRSQARQRSGGAPSRRRAPRPEMRCSLWSISLVEFGGHRSQQSLLVAEVMVEGAAGQAGRGGQLRPWTPRHSPSRGTPAGGGQQLHTGFLDHFGAGSGHGGFLVAYAAYVN